MHAHLPRHIDGTMPHPDKSSTMTSNDPENSFSDAAAIDPPLPQVNGPDRRGSATSVATVVLNEAGSPSKEGYEPRVSIKMPSTDASSPHEDARGDTEEAGRQGLLAARLVQATSGVVVFLCFSKDLRDGYGRESAIPNLVFYVLLVSAIYSGCHIPVLLAPGWRQRAEYVFVVLLCDSTFAFLYTLVLILFQGHGPAKVAGNLIGSLNILLFFLTLSLELRTLLRGRAGPSVERGRAESAPRSNPLREAPERVAKPSERSVATVGLLQGARSKVTGGKSELSTARAK